MQVPEKSEHLVDCSSSSDRHVVFIQPSQPTITSFTQSSLLGGGSEPVVGRTRVSHILASVSALCSSPRSPDSASLVSRPSLSTLPAQRGRGNAQRSGSRAEDSSLDLPLLEYWDEEARPLPSSHHTQRLPRMTNNRENRRRTRAARKQDQRLCAHTDTAGAEQELKQVTVRCTLPQGLQLLHPAGL